MSAQHDQDLYITEIRTPVEDDFDDPESALRNAYRYLKHLPRVNLIDIPNDQKECSICQVAYGIDENDEKIVQLPQCGHRFGFECVYDWLSPMNIPNRNTCPMCREVLFEFDENKKIDDTLSGLRDFRSDILPELRDFHNFNTIPNFSAAIDSFEPYTLGTAQLPAGILWTNQMLLLWFSFSNLVLDFARVDLEDVARKMGVCLGHAYRRFALMIVLFEVRFPWSQAGPEISTLLDYNTHEVIVEWLASLNRIERSDTYNASLD